MATGKSELANILNRKTILSKKVYSTILYTYTQYEIDMKHCSSQARFHMERATKRAFVSASKAREHKNSIQVADWLFNQNNCDVCLFRG